MDHSNHVKSQLEMSRSYHDVSGIDKLRRAAQQGDDNALREAAQQFEAIFVQMMLKSMRKAQDALADKDSPFNTEQVKFYRDMHDQQLAVDLSSKGTIGIADLIVQQMSPGENGFTPSSVIRDDGNLSSLNWQQRQSINGAQEQVLGAQGQTPTKLAAFTSPGEFVATLLPQAEQAAQALGIDPKALIAQAAVETGWGKFMIHDSSGNNSHNLFGIKADRNWQGGQTAIDTLEFEQGVAQKQKANFRNYSSFEDSFNDYVSFVKDNPRYRDAMNNSSDPKAYFEQLQQAGYATDPQYTQKVLSVLDSQTMQSALGGR